ncbi:MAG: hypothetical protein KGN36_17315 [Acidobacteriota bacterium]|nr:hypothetical protein [Acidobacteriota bacterium]
MAHGLHPYRPHHPPLARMTGEKSLLAAGILLIAFVLLALFYLVLQFLENPA